jgi:hypothetical protein
VVSVEQRRPALIESYVRDITPDLYGAFWMRRRIVEELTDHLLEAAHRFHGQGISWAEAEERAVSQFGSPRLVARTFAQSKGVGVPTTFTRYSGLAAIIGALLTVIAFVWQELSLAFEHSLFGTASAVGGTLIAIAMFGMYIRTRGQLGRTGRFAFRLTVIGFVMGFGSGMFYFGPGWFLGLLVMLVGLFVYFAAVVRADVLPRTWVLTLVGGIVFAILLGLFGWLTGIEGNGVTTSIGAAAMMAGFIGIGWNLWSEEAVESSEWSDPVSPA